MMPTIPLKRKVRTDAMAQMQDTNAISQAAVPQGDIAKAPTLARTYRPPPLAGKGQGAGPQRQSFGGPTAAAMPAMAPKSGVLAGLASGLKDARPPMATPNAPGNVNVKVETPPMVDINTTPPPPPAQTADEQRDALDQQIRDFVSGRVSGANDVDTTEQEALIRDLVEGKTGQALVDQRARGGRAGFATSGAQQAIEGDIRKQAGQAASGDILDLRRTEQQRAFDNATKAIETESGMRSAASDDALRRMYLEALQKQSDLETPPTSTTDDIRNLSPEDYATAPPADEQYFANMSPAEQANVAVSKIEGDTVWLLDRNVDPPKVFKTTLAVLGTMTGTNVGRSK